MSEEEGKGMRISVTFPSKDAEWLQQQVEKGNYTSLAEVIRMCVRTMRGGGPGVSVRPQGVTIPTEVALEAVKKPERFMHLLESLSATVKGPVEAKEKAKKGPPAPHSG